jgi:hypothetical protein
MWHYNLGRSCEISQEHDINQNIVDNTQSFSYTLGKHNINDIALTE